MKQLIQILLTVSLIGCRQSDNKDTASTPTSDSIVQSLGHNPTSSSKPEEIPKGRCDVAIVSRTDTRINLLREEDIFEFLYTFSDVCKTNVEYDEFSNEVLFKVLLKYPDLFSEALHKDSIYQTVIYNVLENPVQLQPVEELRTTISTLAIPDSVRIRILKAYNR